MGRTPVAERINVRGNCLQLHAVMVGPLDQKVGVVDSLRPGEDLLAAHKHVVRVGVLDVVGVGHRVEGTHGQREFVKDKEVGVVLGLGSDYNDSFRCF